MPIGVGTSLITTAWGLQLEWNGVNHPKFYRVPDALEILHWPDAPEIQTAPEFVETAGLAYFRTATKDVSSRLPDEGRMSFN